MPGYVMKIKRYKRLFKKEKNVTREKSCEILVDLKALEAQGFPFSFFGGAFGFHSLNPQWYYDNKVLHA